jgi:hypothetical protein
MSRLLAVGSANGKETISKLFFYLKMSLQFIKPESIPFNIKIIDERALGQSDLEMLGESNSFEIEHLKKVVDWEADEKIQDLEVIAITKRK